MALCIVTALGPGSELWPQAQMIGSRLQTLTLQTYLPQSQWPSLPHSLLVDPAQSRRLVLGINEDRDAVLMADTAWELVTTLAKLPLKPSLQTPPCFFSLC